MAGPLYLSAVSFIKNRPFDVYVPAYYHPYLPEDMKNPQREPLERVNRFRMVPTRRRNPMPFRQIMDPHQLQRAAYTVEIMLDMFKKQVEFELVNEEDVVEVFEGIDRYLMSLQDDIKAGSEQVITYVKLLLQFREPTYKHYYRYMMSNPTALEKLYPNNDREQNIFSLLASVNGTSQEKYNLDPLRAKAHPPIDTKDLLPKAENEPSPDMMMESSLGLMNSNMLPKDDGKDFSFDDFLKKG